MTSVVALQAAIEDVMSWAKGKSEWPASAAGLIDIAATGLATMRIDLPAAAGEPDAVWIAQFYAAARKLLEIDPPRAASFRTRTTYELCRREAAYHCEAAERLAGGSDGIADSWAGLGGPKLAVGFAELLSHLASAFAVHGRVAQCGPDGRALLTGPVKPNGDERFLPRRPNYRVAGDLMAEVELNFGLPIFVDLVDDSVCPDIIRTGWWEPWNDGIVRRSVGPGDVVVNVGANVGYYMLLMAKLVQATGKVFAFECNPRLVNLLERSLTWGGLLATTTVFPFAASNQRGFAEINVARRYLGGGGLPRIPANARAQGLSIERIRAGMPHLQALDDEDIMALTRARRPAIDKYIVSTARIDDTVGRIAPEIHFLLIDAEGAEPLVLEGAKDLIRRSRDLAMIVEWSNGPRYVFSEEQRTRARDTITWLADDGFRFWTIEGDARDVYSRPAILKPITAEEVINMDGYGDLYLCR